MPKKSGDWTVSPFFTEMEAMKEWGHDPDSWLRLTEWARNSIMAYHLTLGQMRAADNWIDEQNAKRNK